MKNNKSFSEAVAAGCIIAAIVVVLAECASAQNHCGPLLKWNNAAAFKDKPSPKILDWSTYPETWDGKQFATWGVFAASGILWGMREAYHADPYCFENKWGVGQNSFFGSDAWKRNYVGNNPDNPHKKETFGNVGRDIWHTAGFSSNTLLLSGSFAIGARKQPAKYRALNIILGVGIRSAFASLTYNHFRQ